MTKTFTEGVLAERRDSGGLRTTEEVKIDWKDDEFLITIRRPAAAEIKNVVSKFEGRDDSDVSLEELEEVVDEYLEDPDLEEMEEFLTLGEYQLLLGKVIKAIAGVSDEFAQEVQKEIEQRSDGSEGN